MNKQELIKKYEMKGEQLKEFPVVAIGDVLKNLRELDEPKPVKIPQFVADWVEESRKTCKDVADFLNFDFTNEEVGKWFMQERPFDLVARAWLDGYEVEKEKRYRVKMKGIDTNFNFLNRHRNENHWIFSIKDKNTLYQTHHTQKELEDAGFGWVFDCEGIEIEEVENGL
jgi:phage protein|nr:MAG TPA: Protein of unknown function (DUF1642) [Caudoviricetes sp.]